MNYKLRYEKQLKHGCRQGICYKVFCKKNLDESLISSISELLSGYGDVFLCENVHKVLDHHFPHKKHVDKGFIPLDFFFHCNDKVFGTGLNNTVGRKNTQEVDDLNSVSSYIYSIKSKRKTKRDSKPIKNSDVPGRPRQSLKCNSDREDFTGQFQSLKINGTIEAIDEDDFFDHKFCRYFSKKNFSAEEIVFLTEVTKLLLKRYEAQPHFTCGMMIVRIYSMISHYYSLESYYFSILYKIFCNIHSLYSEFVRKDIPEVVMCSKGTKSSGSMCLNTSKFTKHDLISMVDAISALISSNPSADLRESKKLENLFNIFHLLYLINDKCSAISYKQFYLSKFCSNLNFKEEFRYFRTKSKTPLTYSFILPVQIKAELIKYENNDLMKSTLQESFFRALFEGHVDPYLFVTVNRPTIYKDSLKIFKDICTTEAKKQLRITFRNEEGVDSGGIRKEYFQLLSQDIKHDTTLFTATENQVWLRPEGEDLETYETIGRIIGIALYNNVVLNIPFPTLFFKKLLFKKTTFDDLKEIEPEIAASLRSLKKCAKEELGALGLTFQIPYTKYGQYAEHELVENGRNVFVSSSNLKLFIDKYTDFYTNSLIKSQFEAMRKGFYSIIERNTMAYLDPKELEKIMMGSNAFDADSIRSTTTYSGYDDDSYIVQMFWDIFRNYDKKKKKKLLQFITGNDRIPIAGPQSLKLVIVRNGCDTDRLPSSQTCFNTLLLPEYSSRDKLEKKLETALELTAGFFLL